jgi:hypothetical protein
MSERQDPFADVVVTEDGFSLPDLKWRELLFIGALRADGSCYIRDPSRPMPPFQRVDLFPEGVRFEVHRTSGRVHLKRV